MNVFELRDLAEKHRHANAQADVCYRQGMKDGCQGKKKYWFRRSLMFSIGVEHPDFPREVR